MLRPPSLLRRRLTARYLRLASPLSESGVVAQPVPMPIPYPSFSRHFKFILIRLGRIGLEDVSKRSHLVANHCRLNGGGRRGNTPQELIHYLDISSP
jgi:hypothetical protein